MDCPCVYILPRCVGKILVRTFDPKLFRHLRNFFFVLGNFRRRRIGFIRGFGQRDESRLEVGRDALRSFLITEGS